MLSLPVDQRREPLDLFHPLYRDAAKEADKLEKGGNWAAAVLTRKAVEDCKGGIRMLICGESISETAITDIIRKFEESTAEAQGLRKATPPGQLAYLCTKFGEEAKRFEEYQKINRMIDVYNECQIRLINTRARLQEKLAPFKSSKEATPPNTLWQERHYSKDVAQLKMLVNTIKAYQEFVNNNENYFQLDLLANPEDVLEPIINNKVIDRTVTEIKLPKTESKICQAALKGERKSMEDVSFKDENSERILCGVFDGHGGASVAACVCGLVQKNFDGILAGCNWNIHQAFEKLAQGINKTLRSEVCVHMHGGTTASIVYIDKKTYPWMMYTCNVGDSKVHVFHHQKPNLRPKLSLGARVISWASPKAAMRAAYYHNMPNLAEAMMNHPYPAELRCNPPLNLEGKYKGLNMPSAWGDVSFARKDIVEHGLGVVGAKVLISDKPKISVMPVENCTIMVSSDGLDPVPLQTVADLINNFKKSTNLAEKLVNYAYNKAGSQDNITAITINVQTKKDPKKVVK